MKRREILKQGVAAIGGAAAAAAAGSSAAEAQTAARPPVAPAARRSFRAFVRTDAGASVQDVRMLPLRDNMVAVRTEATQCCYSIINQALGTGPAPITTTLSPNATGTNVVTAPRPVAPTQPRTASSAPGTLVAAGTQYQS